MYDILHQVRSLVNDLPDTHTPPVTDPISVPHMLHNRYTGANIPTQVYISYDNGQCCNKVLASLIYGLPDTRQHVNGCKWCKAQYFRNEGKPWI